MKKAIVSRGKFNLEDMIAEHIRRVLWIYHLDMTRAAEALGFSRATMYRHIEKLGGIEALRKEKDNATVVLELPKRVEDLLKHAKKRAQERYQEFLTDADLRELNRGIAEKTEKLLWRESNTRWHFLLKGKYIVVYNRNLRSISTFLPPESIHFYLDLGGPNARLF